MIYKIDDVSFGNKRKSSDDRAEYKLADIYRELKENAQKLTYTHEHVASYDGQNNYEIGVYMGEQILGVVEYVIYRDEISVSMITVLPKYRRRGLGARLIQKMKELHPDAKYRPSLKTDLGADFKHKTFTDSEMETMDG